MNRNRKPSWISTTCVIGWPLIQQCALLAGCLTDCFSLNINWDMQSAWRLNKCSGSLLKWDFIVWMNRNRKPSSISTACMTGWQLIQQCALLAGCLTDCFSLNINWDMQSAWRLNKCSGSLLKWDFIVWMNRNRKPSSISTACMTGWPLIQQCEGMRKGCFQCFDVQHMNYKQVFKIVYMYFAHLNTAFFVPFW